MYKYLPITDVYAREILDSRELTIEGKCRRGRIPGEGQRAVRRLYRTV